MIGMKAVTTHNFCTNVSFACDVNQMSGKKRNSAECLGLAHAMTMRGKLARSFSFTDLEGTRSARSTSTCARSIRKLRYDQIWRTLEDMCSYFRLAPITLHQVNKFADIESCGFQYGIFLRISQLVCQYFSRSGLFHSLRFLSRHLSPLPKFCCNTDGYININHPPQRSNIPHIV